MAWQEELDWTLYAAFDLYKSENLPSLEEVEPLASEHRPFAIKLARQAAGSTATHYWFEAMGIMPITEIPAQDSQTTQERIRNRLSQIEASPELTLLETPEYKRKWEPINWRKLLEEAAIAWLSDRIENVVQNTTKPISVAGIISAVQDDERFLTLAAIYQDRQDVDLIGLVLQITNTEAIPLHPYHIYTETGLTKRAAWEQTWKLQRQEDEEGITLDIPVPPAYSQGSRGKSTDFRRTEYWKLRGKLDVPKERFIAFTEIPGRKDPLYGWAGWPPIQRIRVLLALDEDLEDADTPLADRIALLDSAWRLLPDAAREDKTVANRLKAELQSLLGPEGPSQEMLEDWKQHNPPPKKTTRKRNIKK